MFISLTTTSLGINELVNIPPIINKLGARVELSSNHSFEINKKNITNFRNKLFIHNYSPKPIKPFVLNLASMNDETIFLSEKMVYQNIDLSKKLNSPFYSFHAGYASDISPSMMGTKITSEGYTSREQSMEIFTERCKKFSNYANKKKVRLLIENNVCGLRNKKLKKSQLLLLSHIDEIEAFFKNMYGECGLLLDLAHLKVSANNLDFDLQEAVQRLLPFTQGLHLSENDGFEDTNEFFDENSWFLKYIKQFRKLEYVAIETKKASVKELEKMYELVVQNL